MTEQTKKAKRVRNWLLAAQLAIMLGTVLFLILWTVKGLTPSEFNAEEELGNMGTLLTSLGISLGITSLLLIVVGHKIRNTLWMGCVILGAYLFGNKGMWVVFILWAVDEYILYPLYKRAQAKLLTNKEMDKRC